jgi:vancomycin resistance protein VanJ
VAVPPPVERPARKQGWSASLRNDAALGALYLLVPLAAIATLRVIGERWWPCTAALYFPRIVFAMPAVLVAGALLLTRRWRILLLLTPLCVALQLFPIMGLSLGSVRPRPAAAGPSLRLLSFNIDKAKNRAAVVATIAAARADVVVLQEWSTHAELAVAAALPGFHRAGTGQFAVFSRYPVSVTPTPAIDELPDTPDGKSAAAFLLESPWGPTTLLNVHPRSPRRGFEHCRRDGFMAELSHGRLCSPEGAAMLIEDAGARERQADAIARLAEQSLLPVILAGDTNLPGLSRIHARTLGRFDDAFSQAASGFGYTYPSARPWMRLDRIMGLGLRFRDFTVIAGPASDHLAIMVEIMREPSAAP